MFILIFLSIRLLLLLLIPFWVFVYVQTDLLIEMRTFSDFFGCSFDRRWTVSRVNDEHQRLKILISKPILEIQYDPTLSKLQNWFFEVGHLSCIKLDRLARFGAEISFRSLILIKIEALHHHWSLIYCCCSSISLLFFPVIFLSGVIFHMHYARINLEEPLFVWNAITSIENAFARRHQISRSGANKPNPICCCFCPFGEYLCISSSAGRWAYVQYHSPRQFRRHSESLNKGKLKVKLDLDCLHHYKLRILTAITSISSCFALIKCESFHRNFMLFAWMMSLGVRAKRTWIWCWCVCNAFACGENNSQVQTKCPWNNRTQIGVGDKCPVL